jgi:hypothetical protein
MKTTTGAGCMLAVLLALVLCRCGDACNPTPQITSISPTSAPVGTTNLVVTITGKHFHSDSYVLWGEFQVYTLRSVTGTQIVVAIPPDHIATPGPVAVKAGNMPGTGGLQGPCGGGPSNALTFTVQ